MEKGHQFIPLTDGISLYTSQYPAANAKANVIFLHGYTEHSGRYSWMYQKLTQSGINVYSYDHRGYGKSEGVRAYIETFKTYISDLQEYIQMLELPQLPTFLMGHSMGSLIGAHYLVSNPNNVFTGFISSAGALKIDEDISPLLRKLSGVISRIAPHLRTIKLNVLALSRDKKVINDYQNDPLVYHGGAKARMGYELLQAMKDIQLRLNQLTLPVLLLHGTADKLADPLGSQWMYDKISSSDKQILWYDGVYHELMHEPEKEHILQDVISWILQRI